MASTHIGLSPIPENSYAPPLLRKQVLVIEQKVFTPRSSYLGLRGVKNGGYPRAGKPQSALFGGFGPESISKGPFGAKIGSSEGIGTIFDHIPHLDGIVCYN
mgnify:CR=1 FL=1